MSLARGAISAHSRTRDASPSRQSRYSAHPIKNPYPCLASTPAIILAFRSQPAARSKSWKANRLQPGPSERSRRSPWSCTPPMVMHFDRRERYRMESMEKTGTNGNRSSDCFLGVYRRNTKHAMCLQDARSEGGAGFGRRGFHLLWWPKFARPYTSL